MGVVITVMNMKGGVGKTTVSAHVGGAIAHYGVGGAGKSKVLLIDYDPQFNLSQAMLPSRTYFTLEAQNKTILSVLVDDDDDVDPWHIQVPGSHNPPPIANLVSNIYRNKTTGDRLDLVPSTLDLMYIALGRANSSIKPLEERFSKFIAEAKSIYDFIIIDCHPAGSVFTQTSLGNSEHVLIPVAPSKYAIRGVGLMTNFIKSKDVPKSIIPHILFNDVPRTGVLALENSIRNNKSYKDFCMTTTLKHYSVFGEPEEGVGFVWDSKKPWSTQAFLNLMSVTREIVRSVS